MGTHGKRLINENNEMFCDVFASNGLEIEGTLFPHKTSHKLKWRSPDEASESQIDHVAIGRTRRSSLQNTRVKRSAGVGSDYYLVAAEVLMKLLALKKPRPTRRKSCTYRLRDQPVREEFAIALENNYDALYNG